MTCLSAGLRRFFANGADAVPEFPIRLSYGFIMDGVLSFRNVTNSTDVATSSSSYRLGGVMQPAGNLSVRGVSASSAAAASVGVAPLPGSSGTSSANAGIARHILVFPDPEFEVFEGVKQFYYVNNEYLTINVSSFF